MTSIHDDLLTLEMPEMAKAWEEACFDTPEFRLFRNKAPIRSYKEKPELEVLVGGFKPEEAQAPEPQPEAARG